MRRIPSAGLQGRCKVESGIDIGVRGLRPAWEQDRKGDDISCRVFDRKEGIELGRIRLKNRLLAGLAVFLILVAGVAQCMAQEHAKDMAYDEGTENLAKQAQNPVADLISIPLQNNFNFNVGPDNSTQYVGNLQPVIPFHTTENWNIITRTIIPIVYQPQLAPGVGDVWGMGDTLFTAFLSPSKPGDLIWGAGPAVLFPSGTDNSITTGKWAAGPSAVALKMTGHWVYGALVNYLSSFAGQDDRGAVSAWTIQPFLNYNLPGGWYLVSAPIVTANMMADSEQWTVPLGGGAGRIVWFGGLPVNLSLQSYYNVARPDGGPEWNIRFSLQFLLPK